jgi:hypothetical protein
VAAAHILGAVTTGQLQWTPDVPATFRHLLIGVQRT